MFSEGVSVLSTVKTSIEKNTTRATTQGVRVIHGLSVCYLGGRDVGGMAGDGLWTDD